jgi:hypothetical protein
MFRKPLLIVVLVLGLASLACNFNVRLPVQELRTGPTVTDEITVPNPSDTEVVAEVEIAFGAGELKLSSGATTALVSGTVTYNVTEFKPKVTTNGNKVTISQENTEIRAIPNIRGDFKNEWDLKFGEAPMSLRINAGAYQGRFDLGGLALHNLRVTDGAAESRLSFSEPNLVEMDTLRYETGASKVTITGLGNANLSNLIFKGGAGDYTLDFSGQLQRDATVSVESGLSSLTIIVPEGVGVNLSMEGGLTNVNASGAWRASGSDYVMQGDGPQLDITIQLGAGNLELRNP